jgi:UPF0176 protein
MVCNLAAYLFTPIDAPAPLVQRLRERCTALELRGTVLVAPEGINLFLAGSQTAITAFIDEMRAQPRFAALTPKLSYSGHVPFARLRVRLKREIIAFRRAEATPLVAPRAPAVDPATLVRWLDAGCDDSGRPVVLLDTRNREEFGYGTFRNAVTLPIDNFADFPAAFAAHREQLPDATIVSFCTGGIRCEKAALWLQQQGLPHVHQLEGGILGWFERQGGKHYQGDCFVFDRRVALDPRLRPLYDAAEPGEAG